MPTLLEQLQTAQSEVTRLSGLNQTLQTQLAAIPAGAAGIASLTAERDTAVADITRVTGELTAARADVARVNAEMETLRGSLSEQVENRAAEVVAGTGVAAAAADTSATSLSGGKPAAQRTYQEHWDHYSTLRGDEKNAYYAAHTAAMNSGR